MDIVIYEWSDPDTVAVEDIEPRQLAGECLDFTSVASLLSPRYLTRGAQKTRDNIHY